jgi:glyoxylase-like metal-dependent hydrolase (beta-lactamase superfamily II)
MVEKILPGLYRIVLPLSGNPLREINSFVFTSADRNLIVDTGMNRDECREAIESGLDSIGVDLERTDIIATHYHADHQGLVATLLRKGSRAFMGEFDAAAISGDNDYWTESGPMGRLAIRAGFPSDVLRASLENHPGFKDGPKVSVDYVGLKDGDTIAIGDFNLTVITTPGHTDGHICLYEPAAKFLISGDHILGDITPNLQAWGYDEDPLADFLASLERTRQLDIDLCLPGHRSLIENCEERIDELIEHHRVRADEVLSILRDNSLDAYDIAGRMSWDIRARSWNDFPIMQRWFATGEAIAHIRYLENKGLIERRLEGEVDLYNNCD